MQSSHTRKLASAPDGAASPLQSGERLNLSGGGCAVPRDLYSVKVKREKVNVVQQRPRTGPEEG
jgi:hypothetical protein